MAIALNVFQAGEKAIAQEVNDNFSMLQEEITTSIDGIKSDVQSSFTEAKEQILGDIEVVNNSKLNLNLDNVSDEGKEKIIGLIAPNYTAGYSISSGFVTPCLGWCYFGGQSDGTSSVKIDDVYFEVSWDKDDGQSRGELFVCVGANTTINSFTRIREARFFPCKGVE